MLHAASIISQLPRESRFTRALVPDAEWSDEVALLVKIDYELRLLMWAQADRKKRGPEPKPIEPPSRRKEMEERLEGIDVEETNRLLGIGGEDNG